MPVIAVVNGKGGSGKSTLATHLAAWCARQGNAVMLGDVDRQQSSRTWLRQRAPDLPTIATWAGTQTSMLRVPSGITHVVLDTPGGLHGFDLARVVMFADAIIMPVGGSIFDRDATAGSLAELRTMPRVANGRCRLAGVGMRIQHHAQADATLQRWAAQQHLPMLGVLRECDLYAQCIEQGMTMFDLDEEEAGPVLNQWQPILDWLMPILGARQFAAAPTPAAPPVTTPARTVVRTLPARETVLSTADAGPAPLRPERRAASPFLASRESVATRPAGLEPQEHIPSFLRHAS